MLCALRGCLYVVRGPWERRASLQWSASTSPDLRAVCALQGMSCAQVGSHPMAVCVCVCVAVCVAVCVCQCVSGAQAGRHPLAVCVRGTSRPASAGSVCVCVSVSVCHGPRRAAFRWQIPTRSPDTVEEPR